VFSIAFKHFSRKAWERIYLLSGRTRKKIRCPIDPYVIGKQIVEKGGSPWPKKTFVRWVLNELEVVRENDFNSNHHLGVPVIKDELKVALKATQPREELGPEGAHNELSQTLEKLYWLVPALNACLSDNLVPEMWRRASTSAIFGIMKPHKISSSPKSYRPISLLSCSYKFYERLILEENQPNHWPEQAWASADIFPARGGNVEFLLIISKLLTMQWINGLSQNGFPFLHHKENDPCNGNSHKKCASSAAMPRTQVYYDLHQCFSIGVPQVAARGFAEKGPKFPGTKLATTILCGCNNVDTCIIA